MNNNFNWDDINVGNYKLDHSQNYFTTKTLNTPKLKINMNEPELNVLKLKLEDITICESNVKIQGNVKKENITETALKKEEFTNDEVEEKENKSGEKMNDVEVKKPIANLCQEWSIREDPKVKSSSSSKVKSAPHAYQFMTLYQRKKEQAIKKRDEELRKMREFTSRPVPQFYSNPMLPPKHKVHAVTLPKTPQVLKRPSYSEERKQRKTDQLRSNGETAVFKSRPPTVLKEKPFIPNKPSHAPPKVCPFNLQSERRVQERKKFDAEKHKALEIKSKQEEEERIQQENKCIKELRKFATFKAQPNPFKK